MWLSSPLFSCLLPVGCVCFQPSLFNNQSVDQWIIIYMLGWVYLCSLICHKHVYRRGLSVPRSSFFFFFSNLRRAVTAEALRLWAAAVWRQRASTVPVTSYKSFIMLLMTVKMKHKVNILLSSPPLLSSDQSGVPSNGPFYLATVWQSTAGILFLLLFLSFYIVNL